MNTSACNALKYDINSHQVVIGVCVGMALGINIGREKPLLSNPFVEESLVDRVKDLGSETLEQSGKALEKTGRALQGK